MRFFDGRDGHALPREIECGSDLQCIDYRPDGGALATGHVDDVAREWRLPDGSLAWEREPALPSSLLTPGQERGIGAIAYAPGGRRLACSTNFEVFAVVFDLETGEQVWTSEDLGSRIGEPMLLRWSPDGRRLWSAFASGVMELSAVTPAPGAEREVLAHGRVPTSSAPRPDGSALAATILAWTGVAVLDPSTGAVRWIRAEDAGGGAVLQAPTGHFATELDSLDGWTLVGGSGEEPVQLASGAEGLFDPKRVRASAAGVR